MAPTSPTRGRTGRDRYISPERIIFIVVLSCSLLLLSIAMLRSEAPTNTRTFRDGFIVANRQSTERRTFAESTPEVSQPPTPSEPSSLPSNATTTPPSSDSALATRAKTTTELVVDKGEHTTLIKTEDGDEITIKRGANSKKKITKISTHEDGKITIENKEPSAENQPVGPQENGEVTKEKKEIRIEQ
ncbi:hypothetical protein PINS_up010733 [Pythium insidiosum]|nr:hypothetical protein PINS_up010733 [Pythium insidiosum]